MLNNILILSTILIHYLSLSNAIFTNDDNIIRSRRTSNKTNILYPKVIPYRINVGFESKTIRNVFSYLQKQTCLKFVEKNADSLSLIFKLGQEDRVSNIGANPNAPTTIQMKYNCTQNEGCVKHLLGLALGLYLEITRHDRDNYIEVFWGNITESEKHWIKKVEWKDSWVRNTGFDYGSIMASPIKWKSKNGKAIFKSKLSKYYDFMVGQRYEYAFNDIKHINDLYCGNTCKRKVKGCTNGGYPDPKKCKHCRCPEGFAGKQCTTIRRNKPICGKRMLRATREMRELIIEGIKDCFFYIKSDRHKKIRIIVAEINTPVQRPCFKNMGLEIKYRHNKGATGLCLCGHYRKYSLNPFNSRVLVHYTGQTENDKLHLKYIVS